MASRGGYREGSGRKSKAEEMGLPALIEEVLGEQGKRDIIVKLFEKAKAGSYLHTQLLMAYMYGKPQDHVDITSGGDKMETVREIVFRDYSGKLGT
jgi:hypothetical protein